MQIEMELGSGSVLAEVPDDRYVGGLRPAAVQPVDDVHAATLASLSSPIVAPPLSDLVARGSSVLILTVDDTRPSPRPLLEPLVQLCQQAGAEATICIAIGRHDPMSQGAITDHLGQELCQRCRIEQHDPFADDQHLELGTTSRGTPVRVNRILTQHDLVIGVGFVEPSYLAGMTGGRKLIMPGISHHASIDANHYLLLDPRTKIGVVEGNPLSEDAAEIARMVRFDWLTCAVVGPQDEVVAVYSGDPFQAHDAACRGSAGIYRVPLRRANVVLASAGAFPYDCDLVQGKKAVVPATEAVLPGGTVILFAECRNGWGAEGTFRQWLTTKAPEQVVTDVHERELFSLGAHGAYILAKPIVERDAEVVIVTSKQMAGELQGSYVFATDSVAEALARAHARGGPEATYLAIHKARRLILE